MRCLPVALPVAALLAFVPSTEAGPSAKTVKIAASASPWTVVGSRLGITGSVTPHAAGLEVTLQQRHGTGWLPVGDRNVRPDGAFSFVARPDKAGLAIYRVVTSNGTDFVGSSDRVPVRVLHWTIWTAARSSRTSSGEYRLRLRINVPDPTNAGA